MVILGRKSGKVTFLSEGGELLKYQDSTPPKKIGDIILVVDQKSIAKKELRPHQNPRQSTSGADAPFTLHKCDKNTNMPRKQMCKSGKYTNILSTEQGYKQAVVCCMPVASVQMVKVWMIQHLINTAQLQVTWDKPYFYYQRQFIVNLRG